MSNSTPDDVTIVTSHYVSCDGGGGALGHPKVFMEMGDDNAVRCKYCDRVFALDTQTAHPAAH